MGDKELEFIQEAFSTNWIAPLGPHVEGFEKDIEQFLESEVFVAALSSGTAALHLALILCGVSKGDEVICQSMTFSASANPIVYQGATPVFVDSHPENWNLHPEWLEQAIKERIVKGKKPKAVIAVHLYGMPFFADKIISICREYDIPLIEDAAEALGSSYKGKKCGTFGNFGVLSFNGNKIITTSGGGALVCRTIEDKQKAVFLSTQARDPAPHYQHSEIGYNYRLSNVLAGIGRGQMQVLPHRIQQRRANHQRYKTYFKGIKGVKVFEEVNNDFYSNHWLTCIQVQPEETGGITRETLRLAFERENIESRPLWKPMHLQPVFKDAPFYGDGTSERMFANGLCLPSGSNLTEDDFERIFAVMDEVFGR